MSDLNQHGLDVEDELVKILQYEIMRELHADPVWAAEYSKLKLLVKGMRADRFNDVLQVVEESNKK